MKYDPTNINQLEEYREKRIKDADAAYVFWKGWEFFLSLPFCGIRFSDLEYLELDDRRPGYHYYAHRPSNRVFAYITAGKPRGARGTWREVSRERDWATIILTRD